MLVLRLALCLHDRPLTALGARRRGARLLRPLLGRDLGPEARSSGGCRLPSLAERPLRTALDAAGVVRVRPSLWRSSLPAKRSPSRLVLATATAAAFLAAC